MNVLKSPSMLPRYWLLVPIILSAYFLAGSLDLHLVITAVMAALLVIILMRYSKVEREHRQTEARLRAIVGSLPFDLWVNDPDGRCILQNPQSVALWGEVMGKTITELEIPEATRAVWLSDQRRVMQGEILRGEAEYAVKGEQRQFDYVTVPVRDGLETIGVVGVNIDITDRKRAEDALRHNEEEARTFLERLRALQKVTAELAQAETFDDLCRKSIELGRSQLKFDRMGIWLLDEDPLFMVGSFGTDETGNTRDERHIRLPADENLFPRASGLMTVENRQVHFQPNIRLLNDRAEVIGWGWNAMGHLTDGARIIGAVSIDNFLSQKPIEPFQLEVLALYCNTLGALFVRKRAEMALQASEARFRSIFASASLGIAVADADGYVVSANPAVERMLGYPFDELRQMTFASFTHSEDRDRDLALFRQLLVDTMDHYFIEKRYIRKDGSSFWARLNVSRFPGTEPNCVMALLEDIDARISAQEEVLKLNATLEKRVVERTAELQAANERLTELDRLKTKFISDVTHELRTPLAVLNTRVYLLQHGPPEKQAIHLTALKEQLERLANFVNTVLDLSRLELGRERIVLGAVNLNQVVRQVVAALAPRAQVNGLSLSFERQEPLPPVCGEFNQLAQVVTNLVANAINYTANGGVEARTVLDDERHQVRLEVTDTGMGIPANDIPHLFTRFYRGEQTGQTTIPGTGLGLSIVKEVVDLHAGSIEVQSEVGQGSTFRIWLPLYDPKRPLTDPQN